jgi:3-methyladenine DNA glycosylase AlkC
MAKKFKDYYDQECAQLLAGKISGVWPDFDSNGFVRKLEAEIHEKEFLQRQDAFAMAFETFMTGGYGRDISIFHQILGTELQTTEGMFTYGWWLWPVGRYIERNGTKDFQASIDFIYELTKRFTGEFAVRPLIEKYPKQSLKIILKWSMDENVHVRRLASEGVRMRLPWAKKLLIAIHEFETYKQILTNLKNAPEKFIQKSVGNNLNDLMKESPDLAMQIISEWQNDDPGKATQWIIKHGLRSERKKVNKQQIP